MTLLKVHLGRKKEKSSLRPLSEKDIQKKLYGDILQTSEVLSRKETEWVAPPPKFKREFEKKVTIQPRKKISISIPWDKIELLGEKILWVGGKALLLSGVILKSLLTLGKAIFSRIANGWTLIIIAVFALFFAVQGLNSFRTSAMKKTKLKSSVTAETFHHRKRSKQPKAVQALPEAVEPRQEAVPNLMPLSSAVSVVKEPPVSIEKPLAPPTPGNPDKDKPYVVQVCTYANEADADKLVQQMKDLHLSAFTQSLARSNGRTFYLVFLGRFQTFQEAQKKLKEFKSEPISKDFQDSFVREL